MAAPVKLTKATKEYVPVDLFDKTDVITDLSASSPVFDVIDEDEVFWYTNQAGVGSAMRISCLIDTSSTHSMGEWPLGLFRLFVEFTNAPEIPRIGPIDLIIYDHN